MTQTGTVVRGSYKRLLILCCVQTRIHLIQRYGSLSIRKYLLGSPCFNNKQEWVITMLSLHVLSHAYKTKKVSLRQAILAFSSRHTFCDTECSFHFSSKTRVCMHHFQPQHLICFSFIWIRLCRLRSYSWAYKIGRFQAASVDVVHRYSFLRRRQELFWLKVYKRALRIAYTMLCSFQKISRICMYIYVKSPSLKVE